MMRYLIFGLMLFFIASCESTPKEWVALKTIELGNVTPIGIVSEGDGFWISDGDHNRLIKVDSSGQELQAFEDLERPMHIDSDGGKIYFPEYGSDTIRIVDRNEVSYLSVEDSLDAPAGISIKGNEIAIADFYSHRVFYYNGSKRLELGGEGKEKGKFYYPTDVQITDDKIFVADAYNNRVQIFDKEGAFLKAIGELDDINAATGIYVEGEVLYVTDFENSRIIVYDFEGNIIQEITENITKPTDILIKDRLLYVANYKGKNLSVYTK